MHQPQIIQHLFQVSSLEDVSRERLEAFVESYPSFGIGHYLLSCKLQTEDSDLFLTETQRTSLYFSNPLWLQWLLQNSDGVPVSRPVVAEPVAVPVAEFSTEHVTVAPLEEVHQVEETHTPVEEVHVAPLIEEASESVHETPVENVVTMAEEAYVAPAGDDLAEALTSEAEAPSAADALLRSIEEARGLRETMQKLNDEDHSAEIAIAGESVPQEEPIQDQEAPFVLEEQVEEEPEVEAHVTPEAEDVEVPVAETPVVEAPVAEAAPAAVQTPVVAETPKTTPTVTQDFLFEPYHTIDYFASQGIKLTLDEVPTDKLGKQLKSFTEWLKTMRRLPQKDREVVPDRVAEEAVQTSAASSLERKDVLTETMAEVLAKQGMREKARAVYEKLSLLNPDKRAYFAAKIEQLNIP